MMQNHPYAGSLLVCKLCFKKRDDAIHQIGIQTVSKNEPIVEVFRPLETPHIYEGETGLSCLKCHKPANDSIHEVKTTQPIPSVRDIMKAMNRPDRKVLCDHPYEGSGDICSRCLRHRTESIHPEREVSILKPDGKSANGHAENHCIGHGCPKCSKEWFHDYDCKKSGPIGLCPDCAQQSAAIVNRKDNIEHIAKTEYLTGQEAVDIRVKHEEFVVMHLIHDKDGSIRPDWQDRVSEHIAAKKKLIESLRIQISATYQARAKQQCEDLTKLSPEEREAYERAALRNKKAKKPTEKQAQKKEDTQKKAYNDMLSMLVKQISSKRPDLTSEQARQLAEEKAKLLG